VLFVDLDRFKAVNDELGHSAGDELLRAVSARLASVLRPIDVVARMGGDEFVVVCPDVAGPHAAEEVATRLLRALSATPFRLAGRELAITASVGISLSSGAAEDMPERLLRDADSAMYLAKERGRARFEHFDPSTARVGTATELSEP
jgi:diguanylate cyclase (GGDEF)-like protein